MILTKRENQRVVTFLTKQNSSVAKFYDEQLDLANSRVTELLNRLQSGDFRTFAALQQIEPPEVRLRPKTDLEELRILGETQGYGEINFHDGDADDSEFRDAMGELGIQIQDN